MKKLALHLWAEKQAKKVGFKIDKIIYQGEYYSKDKIRNIVYQGKYQNQDAVLKVYHDPRITNEPLNLKNFSLKNRSKLIIAPKLLNYKIISPHQGWLILEKLPRGGKFFKSPLNNNDRKEFINLYFEYRKNFPKKPTRRLSLVEQLPANKYHSLRVARWFELAEKKEAGLMLNGQRPILTKKDFLKRYLKALNIIDKEFSKRKMIWCHGHFKPSEVYKHPKQNHYYLIDFAHSHLYPEGYEFGFIIWADWLMTANWRLGYANWRKGVYQWIEELRPIAKKLKIKNYNNLIKVNIIERILGSILADIAATDRPKNEKLGRIKKLYQLFDELA